MLFHLLHFTTREEPALIFHNSKNIPLVTSQLQKPSSSYFTTLETFLLLFHTFRNLPLVILHLWKPSSSYYTTLEAFLFLFHTFRNLPLISQLQKSSSYSTTLETFLLLCHSPKNLYFVISHSKNFLFHNSRNLPLITSQHQKPSSCYFTTLEAFPLLFHNSTKTSRHITTGAAFLLLFSPFYVLSFVQEGGIQEAWELYLTYIFQPFLCLFSLRRSSLRVYFRVLPRPLPCLAYPGNAPQTCLSAFPLPPFSQ